MIFDLNSLIISIQLFIDVDECTHPTLTHDCDENAACSNDEGGHTCTCNTGYEGTGQECDSMFHLTHTCNINMTYDLYNQS